MSMTVLASTEEGIVMDELDILIATHYFLDSNSEEESFWPDSFSDVKIVPLYNEAEKIVAYYVELEQVGYAVINNNAENPTMIEFGRENNPLIHKILDEDKNAHIIYNSPFSFCNKNDKEMEKNIEIQQDLYENHPDLCEKNADLSSLISEQRAIIENKKFISPYGDGDYGFIDWNDMPSGSYQCDDIPYGGTNWVVTSDFSDIAQNHCGATAVTNLAMYYANRGYYNLKKSNARSTFVAIHKIVGNGPVMTIADKAKIYFSNCGYSLKTSSIGSFEGIKNATKNDRPCGILLADGIVEWHWIISVGYRDYQSGGDYIRIVDGWNRDVSRFYRIGSGSLWVSATQYWI